MKSSASLVLLSLLFFIPACNKLPYIPDEDAVIYLQASFSTINLGERALISIQGQKGNGYSLPDGTVVYLSASRGTLPAEVVLKDGKVSAEYQADETFVGDVEIKARSGQGKSIPEALIITIADRVIDSLSIWANPAQLPYGGGRSTIDVLALDGQQKPVPGKIVFISTSAGSLSGGGARTTDGSGRIRAYLDTDRDATVTASYKDLECTVSIRIDSQNIKPVADFDYSPTEPQSGETVNFNAAASTDSDGYVVDYQWDFGDGSFAAGKIVSHEYNVSSNRTFVVVLSVRDNDGEEGVKSERISIRAVP